MTNYSRASGLSLVTAGAPLVRVATLTPTVAANLDLLSVFTSDYDNYIVECVGITTGSTAFIALHLATGGSVDAGSNMYSSVTGGPFLNITSAAASAQVSPSLLSSGIGCNLSMFIKNVNDATNIKSINVDSVSQTTSNPYYQYANPYIAYKATNTLSGFRLAASVGNFAATGKIRVYGISNT